MPSIVLKVQVLVIMSGPKCCLFSPLCYQFAFFGNSFNQHQHNMMSEERQQDEVEVEDGPDADRPALLMRKERRACPAHARGISMTLHPLPFDTFLSCVFSDCKRQQWLPFSRQRPYGLDSLSKQPTKMRSFAGGVFNSRPSRRKSGRLSSRHPSFRPFAKLGQQDHEHNLPLRSRRHRRLEL